MMHQNAWNLPLKENNKSETTEVDNTTRRKNPHQNLGHKTGSSVSSSSSGIPAIPWIGQKPWDDLGTDGVLGSGEKKMFDDSHHFLEGSNKIYVINIYIYTVSIYTLEVQLVIFFRNSVSGLQSWGSLWSSWGNR